MQPILFHIGSHGVPAYAFALAVAFAAGILLAIHRARLQGLDPAVVIDVSTLIIVTAIFGSRLIWVVSHPELHRPPAGSWTAALNPFAEMGRGGLVGLSVTGGLPLAVAAALLFFAYRRLPVLVYADLLAPSVLLGEAITRLGCFFNGCCHGLASALPWAVRFPGESLAGQRLPGLAVHPTQLYTSLFSLAGLVFLLWLARRSSRPGIVFFAFLAVTGGIRFLLEFIRYNEAAVIPFRWGDTAVSTYQLISLALLLVGIAGMLWWRGAAGGADAEAPG